MIGREFASNLATRLSVPDRRTIEALPKRAIEALPNLPANPWRRRSRVPAGLAVFGLGLLLGVGIALLFNATAHAEGEGDARARADGGAEAEPHPGGNPIQ